MRSRGEADYTTAPGGQSLIALVQKFTYRTPKVPKCQKLKPSPQKARSPWCDISRIPNCLATMMLFWLLFTTNMLGAAKCSGLMSLSSIYITRCSVVFWQFCTEAALLYPSLLVRTDLETKQTFAQHENFRTHRPSGAFGSCQQCHPRLCLHR